MNYILIFLQLLKEPLDSYIKLLRKYVRDIMASGIDRKKRRVQILRTSQVRLPSQSEMNMSSE